MFGLQPTHLLIILVIALLLFVPSRLPEFVRAIGKTFTEFRSSLKEPDSTKSSESEPAQVRKEQPRQ